MPFLKNLLFIMQIIIRLLNDYYANNSLLSAMIIQEED